MNVSTLRNVIATTFVMLSLAPAAMADQLEYCEPIISGGDSAYVPCVSKVDLGNGQIAVYDNDGNLVHIESK